MQCDSAYYAQFTYNWTDAKGQPRTSRLTDVATEKSQIEALIAEVYSNPKIPGKLQSTPVAGDEGYVSYENQAKHWRGLVSTKVPKPEIAEQTMLLVEIKNDSAIWVQNSDCSCLKSVRLLYNAFRIERTGQAYDSTNTTYKPGVLYNVSGTYNKFFLIGKGSGRSYGWEPLDRMFEQYAPHPHSSKPITDFYSRLKNGEEYAVIHDCTSVPYLGHYPTMASDSGTAGAETMSNLVVYIPDYRLINWKSRNTSDIYTYYNPQYFPTFRIYRVSLTASAERKGEVADRTYNVTLSWESNIDNLSDSRVKQDFYIYRVIDGVVDSIPLNAEPINDYSYTYPEPQYVTGRKLTYIITARPSGVSGFNPVESNLASVLIPGYDPYERLVLDIDGTSRSTYDPQRQVNDYANRITIDNNTLSGDFIAEGTTFSLYRFDNDAAGGDSTRIATLVIDTITKVGSQYRFNYTLKMFNQSVATADSVGYLIAASREGDISFNGLSATDRFTASTANNDHKSHYDYVLEFMPVKAAGDAGVKMVHSNVVRLTVPKTKFYVGMEPLTKAQVDADIDHSLAELTNVSMTIEAANSSALRSYTLYRSGTAFAEMQRANNGSYSILTRSADSMRPNQPVAEGLSAGQLSATDDLRDATSGIAAYYPVINSECTLADGTVGINTYGADQKHVSVVGVKVINPTTEKTSPFAYDATSWKMGFGCYFTAKGFFNDSVMGEYNYRVWRVDDDGTETMLTEHLYDGNPNPNVQGNYEFSVGGSHGELLTVRDLFMDNPLKSTDTKTVKYIVRLYCQSEADPSKFYMAEDRFSVIYDTNTPTGLDAVERPAAQVSSVRYIDATGRQSPTPLSGFNIVVTTYTDGTVTTTKRLQR